MHYLEFEFCNQSEHVRVQFLLKFEFYLHNRKNCVRKIYQNHRLIHIMINVRKAPLNTNNSSLMKMRSEICIKENVSFAW